MKPNIQPLKGFRDYLPAEALKRQWFKNKLITIFEAWGYDPLETPTLEPLELFAGQIGEDEKLFFKFKDAGNRDVALRYDQTVPTCRVVGQNQQNLTFPFRRYQIQTAFRTEKPQKGRYREFTQCDADIFGEPGPLADAEVIALSLDIYRQLGFPQAQVKINDRSLLKGIPYSAIVAIDKLAKIGEDGVISAMVNRGLDTDQAKTYLNQVKSLQPNDTINFIIKSLQSYGFDPSWYQFDPTIARSFSYSTGPIWEIIIPNFSGGSVLGGERFDQLVSQVSGQSIPGTGFGLGFDRSLEAASEAKLIPDFQTKTQILVTIFDSSTQSNSQEACQKLRQQALNVELYPNPEAKLGKQLKYASQKGIPFVLVIGPEEVANNTVTLKDMRTGTQTTNVIANILKLF